ncbi:hypothetical protein ACFYYB_40800 [Streptomyces sp. NPDC002886]|uniref:hypothetical protein n=1 Tax=Streptomyces sp. NPDC002886 TaxID=3364667 RepID=UPI003673C8CB
MTKFLNGNFTIINTETGRAVRARLGKSVDVSDHRLGTKYLQSVTDKPTLHLGEADNSPATAWWHETANDGAERLPFNQIVSHAVGEYQNIGNYCVWLHTDALAEADDARRARVLYEDRLDNMPKTTRDKLDALTPPEYWAHRVKKRARELETLESRGGLYTQARLDAEKQAWAEDEDPPLPRKLARYLEIQRMLMGDEPCATSQRDAKLLEEFAAEPRAARVMARAEKLVDPLMQSRKQALQESGRTLDDVVRWNDLCGFVAFEGESGVMLTNTNYRTSEDKKISAAATSYIKAAAKEGITKAGGASSARTAMDGSGASRDKGSTYAWAYDGTYIYGADSRTVPSERTYWTDENGYLVGRNKGGAGQKWKLAPWTPTPQPTDGLALVRTGLLGPLGFFINL